LKAGLMSGGVVVERHEGTPQGGPLSPLLANVLLDEVDRELEGRGHAFIRYADDCNVYVRSRRAGERVMGWLRELFTGLHLKVNEAKSAVDLATRRKVLGYSFWLGPGGVVKRRVAKKAQDKLKERVRHTTRRI
jgi:retron-type reverse transcriptase